MSGEVLSIGAWRNNAELIADVAKLGHLDGTVLDLTYGEGKFWTVFRPEQLTTNDLYKPADHRVDFRATGWPDASYDVVVFDPDYKLSGTPALPEFDARYGTDVNKTRDERMADIKAGAIEGFRLCRRRLLVKCQDQVEGGKMRWQTRMVADAIEECGGRYMDRFDLESKGLPQPPRTKKCPRCGGTGVDPGPEPCSSPGSPTSCRMVGCEHGRIASAQEHARHDYSQLLVFWKRQERTRGQTSLL